MIAIVHLQMKDGPSDGPLDIPLGVPALDSMAPTGSTSKPGGKVSLWVVPRGEGEDAGEAEDGQVSRSARLQAAPSPARGGPGFAVAVPATVQRCLLLVTVSHFAAATARCPHLKQRRR